MNNEVVIERFNYGPDGTFGRMQFPTGEEFYTVERPWMSNRRNISCIPDGTYTLKKRVSEIVRRTSGDVFKQGWEVTEVPNRTYIMLHPANWPTDVQGCIGPGLNYRIITNPDGQLSNAVLNSRKAFFQIMDIMNEYTEWVLHIRPFIMQYP